MSASLADIILLSRLAAKRSTDELKAELGITQMDAFALRRALRNGTINRYCTEGDIFSASLNGVTTIMQVEAIGYDVPANSRYTNALRLSVYSLWGPLVMDSREAVYYAETALAAGTYWFLDTVYNKYYSFTLTKSVPQGGQIVASGVGGSGDGYPLTGFSTFSDATSTAAIETVTATQSTTAPTTGTQLTTINHPYRARFGSGNWLQSAGRQCLNSDKASGWWTPSNKYDRPASTPTAGFLYNFDADLMECMGKVRLRTAVNPYDNAGALGYMDSEELIFLPSRMEMGLGPTTNGNTVYEGPVTESGVVTQTGLPLYTDNASRIKKLNSNAAYYWMRSPDPNGGYPYSVYDVTPTGTLDSYGAYIPAEWPRLV
jgi:hypothetical protein